jgi:hypothetical protein
LYDVRIANIYIMKYLDDAPLSSDQTTSLSTLTAIAKPDRLGSSVAMSSYDRWR